MIINWGKVAYIYAYILKSFVHSKLFINIIVIIHVEYIYTNKSYIFLWLGGKKINYLYAANLIMMVF